MKFTALTDNGQTMEFMTYCPLLVEGEKAVIGKDGHIYIAWDSYDEIPTDTNREHLPVYVNSGLRKKTQRKYYQDEFRFCNINESVWDKSECFNQYKELYSQLPVDEDEVIKSVENSFIWETRVKRLRRNEFNEIIADCVITYPDHEGRHAVSRPYPHECQYMVAVDINWSTGQTHRIYLAKNDRREMTFPESLGFYDENAPRSPYIDAVVEKPNIN